MGKNDIVIKNVLTNQKAIIIEIKSVREKMVKLLIDSAMKLYSRLKMDNMTSI